MATTSRAHSFNAVAAAYAANRPSYPPALFDAVEELAGRPLSGARVADIGAGTGIATALLHERGARIVAVEPGDGMTEQFRRTLPGVPIVRGDGNNLPLADASADCITYAQAWHWTDPARSAPEAMRVLRPGGALALWWNVADRGVEWVADQTTRIQRFFGDFDIVLGAHGTAERTRETGGLDFADRRVPWTREVSIDTHLANLASHSVFLVAGEKATREFLDRERPALMEIFPEGVIREAYVVDLCVTTR